VLKYLQSNQYETAHFDKEWIVLNSHQYTLTKLNESGGFCWSLLSEPQSVESLTVALIDKFGTECESVTEDVSTFLMELMECGLIKHVS
jgi:hypothetical protein